MFKVVQLILGQLQTNCYLVICETTRKCLIIDPADDGQYIIQKLTDHNAEPVAILATHGHFDHNLAGLEIKLTYQIPFYIHRNDEFLIHKMQSSALHWLKIQVDPPPGIDVYLDSLDEIKFGNEKLEIIHTPGHTPGSVCLLSKKHRTIFTGDTLFANGGVGRTDFSYSSDIELKDSLGKILELSGNTIIFPGHGESSTIKTEINNFKFNLVLENFK